MQRNKRLKARILAIAMSVTMAATMMPAVTFADVDTTVLDESTAGRILAIEKLEDRFVPSIGEDAPKHIYGLTVSVGTEQEDLKLPDELKVTVERTSVVSTPSEDEDEIIPDETEAADEDIDDASSDNQPASPSDAEKEIEDHDVPLAPEPKDGEETIVTTVKQETIPVTWNSDKEFTSEKNGGQFIYTAELPEGYILAEGVKLLQIYVFVGTRVRASGDAAITVGSGEYPADKTGLQKAFTDIADDGIITLDSDVALGDAYIEHKSDKNITLDLNGHKVSSSHSTAAFYVNGSAEFTVRGEEDDSKIEYTGTGSAIGNSSGTVAITVESGMIESTNNPDNSTIFITGDGSLIISGGTITSTKGGALYNYNGDITVSGSAIITSPSTDPNYPTIYCGNRELLISGNPVITNSGNSEDAICILSEGDHATITGGTISAASGTAIRATPPLSISGATKVTSKKQDATSGTIIVFDTLTLTDTAQVLNTTATGNAIYLAGSSSSYSMTSTNVVGKIIPSQPVSGTIKGSDTNSGIAATLQLKHSSGALIGNTVTAGADGTYTVQAPKGSGYTIDVSMPGYTAGTIEAFDVVTIPVTGKDLALVKASNDEIVVGGSDTNYPATAAGLRKAFADVSTSGTVRLDADTSINYGEAGVSISNNKSVTLDLNGQTIEYNGGKNTSAIVLQDTASLTVSDGSSDKSGMILIEGEGCHTIHNDGTGTVAISDGTVSATGPAGCAVYSCKGVVTISGGTVSATGPAGCAIFSEAAGGPVTVSGGTVTAGDNPAITHFSSSKVTISGSAKLTSANAITGTVYLYSNDFAEKVILEITGGTVSNTAEDGYAVYFRGDPNITGENIGTYYSQTGGTVGKVFPEPAAIDDEIIVGGDDTNYPATAEGLQKAFTDIPDGGTIKIGADIALGDTTVKHEIAKTVILDLGDKNITYMDGDMHYNTSALEMDSAASLTVIGTTGKMSGNQFDLIQNKGTGTLTIASGTIEGTGTAVISNFGTGALNITGGSILSENFFTTTIYSDSEGTGKITISGDAKIECASRNGGAIQINNVPGADAQDKIILEVKDTASVTNSATDRAIFFPARSGVTGQNVSNYYKVADTATVGKVFPAPVADNPLASAIAAANTAKTGVIVSDSPASSVTSGTKFVTTAEMKALTDAIAAAQAVANNAAATEAEVAAAVTALNTAVTAFKTVIKTGTYTSGGGGSSSSSQPILTSVPPKYTGGTKIIGNVRVPDYTVEGSWKKNADGTWNFTGNGGQTYADSWAPVFNPYADVTKGQSAFDWFMFDANGNMMTGWYTDADKNTFYLNPNSDNTLGAMQTGWVLISGKYYYFNETPDGTRGKLFKNTRTPDGYLVDENGIWDGSEKQ